MCQVEVASEIAWAGLVPFEYECRFKKSRWRPIFVIFLPQNANTAVREPFLLLVIVGKDRFRG